MPNVRASAAVPVAIVAFAPRSRCLPAIVPLSPKARGNIPPASWPNAALQPLCRFGVAAGCLMEYISWATHQCVGAEERMVRAVADRAFLPAKSLFEQVGNMMILTGKTITATVRPPYPYGGEFISQFIFALQLCWFPML